jgi:toxin FitB
MSYLLDTDIVSAFNKRTIPPRLAEWLRLNESDSFLSALAVAEMRHGLPGVDSADHAVMAERLAQTEVRFADSLIPVGTDTLIEWKRLLANLKTVNRTMTCEDSLMAAAAIQGGFTLATNNARHFEPAKQFGLCVVSPL